MKKRIGVMIGSDSDLPQCIAGIKFLLGCEEKREIELMNFDTNSQHRNSDTVNGRLTEYRIRNWPEGYEDILIIGAGAANHLSGCAEARLRYTERNATIRVYAVAFEDVKDPENTLAAIKSITKVPGHQMIFRNYVGADGFLRACQDAVNDTELQPLKLPPLKDAPRRTFMTALKEALRIKKEKEQ